MNDIKIRVTVDCFEDTDSNSGTRQTDADDDTIHGFKSGEYYAYKKAVQKYVKEGRMIVFAIPVAFGLIEISIALCADILVMMMVMEKILIPGYKAI